ncbi:MAG TPA: hypothetical protein VGM30_17070 [Puia sp.]|jgi:hypothetical protein
MPVIPLADGSPEYKFQQLIDIFSLYKPFSRYSLFRTDREWTDDMTILFERYSQELLGVYEVGYDPKDILAIGITNGFQTKPDHILDPQNLYSLTKLGILVHHDIANTEKNKLQKND